LASLGVEFGASRLLAPYFGTSLYVWGVLIGLVLIYLSIGYVIGGRLADRHPSADLLFQLTAWAGLWIGLIPLIAYPILLEAQQGFATVSVGLVLGTLLAVVLLFAVPVFLLPHGIKPPQVGTLLYERDSAYHYIQVVQDGSRTELILNEGQAVHSIYDSRSLLTGGPWDYFMLGSYFRPAQTRDPRPRNVAILGLAGGTAAREMTAAFGGGVDIT